MLITNVQSNSSDKTKYVIYLKVINANVTVEISAVPVTAVSFTRQVVRHFLQRLRRLTA